MRKHTSGFSLLELMAVIFVVGLALGGVSLMVSSGSPENQMQDEIEKFMAIAEFASEKAVLSGESVGLRLEPPQWQNENYSEQDDLGWRYYWVISTYQGWVGIPNLPPVQLPPSIDLEIEIEEVPWEWEEALDRETPLTVFYPSGDISDIAIKLLDERDEELEQNILLDESGDLVWKELMDELEERKEQGY